MNNETSVPNAAGSGAADNNFEAEQNRSVISDLLSERRSIVIRGKSFALVRPKGAALRKIFRMAESIGKNGEDDDSSSAALIAQVIGCCVPGCEDEDEALELVASTGGPSGELAVACMGLCGMNSDLMNEAHKLGEAGSENDGDF